MTQSSRRSFIKTLAAAATVTIAGTKSTGRVLGANETLRIGVAGLNGRGGAHLGAFRGMRNVQVTHLIDPDTRVLKRVAAGFTGAAPRTEQDVRRALEDRNLDAISIATPNHWHALMTIWAAQAGKHVYVEKPSSHNVHEGRIAVEVARKHNVIVQHGTQSRSGGWNSTIAHVKSGKFGRLLVSRGLCYKRRNSIGTRPTGNPPAEIDFGLWLGPAQQTAYHANLVHYNWHWFWDFGNGDIGNQGVHQMDIARWAISDATLPRSVFTVGGRFGYTDQGETPNTEISVMDFGQTKLVFEVRGLQTGSYHGQGVGNIFHLEEGTIAGNQFYPKGKTTPEPLPRLENAPAAKPGGGDHFANFVAAVRSGRRDDLNADILDGHYSSACCHLANLSYRLGQDQPFAPRPQAIDDAEVRETLARTEEHLTQGNSLRLADLQLHVGRKLTFDPRTERFTGEGAEAANPLLTRNYRQGFQVPEKI